MVNAPNTLGVPVRRGTVHWIHRLEDLEALVDRTAGDARTLHFLGDASNVVLMPEIDAELCYVRTRGIVVQDQDHSETIIRVAAGENWHELVRWTVAQGLSGIENLALIPGRAGAAPVQNIGAYGVELSDVFHSAEVYDVKNKVLETWSSDQCGFGYRHSRFKNLEPGRYLIVAISLRLNRQFSAPLHYPDVVTELHRWGGKPATGADLLAAIIRIRRYKLPDVRNRGNVGSFFKNPVISETQFRELEAAESGWIRYPAGSSRKIKLAAAQLIDRCGIKTLQHDKVGVWPRQPLVLFNRNNADGRDFLCVAESIRVQVFERYGVALEIEPSIIC